MNLAATKINQLRAFHFVNNIIIVAEVESTLNGKIKVKRGIQLLQQAVRGQNGQPELQVQFAPIGMPLNSEMKAKLPNLEIVESNVMYSYDIDPVNNSDHKELQAKYDGVFSNIIMPTSGIAVR